MRFLAVIGVALSAGLLGGCSGSLVRVPNESTPTTAMSPVGTGARARVASVEPNVHVVSLPEFDAHHERQREGSLWCWATCATMIHNFNGLSTTQEEVVARVRGNAEDERAAGHRELMMALYPEYGQDLIAHTEGELLERQSVSGVTLQLDDVVKSYTSFGTQTSDHLVNAVSRGEPVVVGLRYEEQPTAGHASVVYAVTYSVEEQNRFLEVIPNPIEEFDLASYARLYSVHSVTLADPLSDEPVEITGEELARRLDFMITRELAKEHLQEEWDAVRIQD